MVPRADHFSDPPSVFSARCANAKVASMVSVSSDRRARVGRVYLEKDTMHIDFLSDKWVSDRAKAGKLGLPCVLIGNRIVLSATTEDLRKFAMQHAEDKEAFSETFAFQRKKGILIHS